MNLGKEEVGKMTKLDLKTAFCFVKTCRVIIVCVIDVKDVITFVKKVIIDPVFKFSISSKLSGGKTATSQFNIKIEKKIKIYLETLIYFAQTCKAIILRVRDHKGVKSIRKDTYIPEF